jgi:hypothetical protein
VLITLSEKSPATAAGASPLVALYFVDDFLAEESTLATEFLAEVSAAGASVAGISEAGTSGSSTSIAAGAGLSYAIIPSSTV